MPTVKSSSKRNFKVRGILAITDLNPFPLTGPYVVTVRGWSRDKKLYGKPGTECRILKVVIEGPVYKVLLPNGEEG